MFVRDVVGQFEFVEGYRLGHPLLARGRAVRVDVHPFGHLRVGFARHHPAGVVELVAAVVRRHDVHEQDVFGFFIQAVDAHFEGRKHPPAGEHRRSAWRTNNPGRILKLSRVVFLKLRLDFGQQKVLRARVEL